MVLHTSETELLGQKYSKICQRGEQEIGTTHMWWECRYIMKTFWKLVFKEISEILKINLRICPIIARCFWRGNGAQGKKSHEIASLVPKDRGEHVDVGMLLLILFCIFIFYKNNFLKKIERKKERKS